MFAKDLRGHDDQADVPPDDWLPEAVGSVDRDALRASASRACCCPARPAVVVLMPPTRDRPYRTDLLLCRHRYRVSRRALAAAGVVVLDPDTHPPAVSGNPAIMKEGVGWPRPVGQVQSGSGSQGGQGHEHLSGT